jgi:class 3 adenylate cyclase
MSRPTLRRALPPIDATTLVIDLRNFTPNLNAAECDETGVNTFCHFLASFYADCLDACLCALSPALRNDPPIYISSTGDGLIAVFHDPDWHVGQGFLATLLLHHVLAATCARYNESRQDSVLPRTGFGIGVESGTICRVHAGIADEGSTPVVNTYIGDCINVAARAEGVSKQLHRAHTIVCPEINRRLCTALLGIDYESLQQHCDSSETDDATHLRTLEEMSSANQQLCLSFMHLHRLRGLDQPLPLYRLSESAAIPGNPRFEKLLMQLVHGKPEHFAEVLAHLSEA